MSEEDITEFEWVDPVELHLVGKAANDFTPLLAKSTEQKEKGKTKLSKKTTIGLVFKSGEQVLAHVLGPFEEAVYKADMEMADNPSTLARERSRSAHMQLTKMKMILGESARQRNPQRHRAKFPNAFKIINNGRKLPEDPSILGDTWNVRRGSYR